MGKRRVVLVASTVVITGVAAWFWFVPHEPSYRGERLSYWLSTYDVTRRNRPDRIDAERAIREIGSNAVPTLLRTLQTRPSTPRMKLVALLDRLPFFAFNPRTAESFQYAAIRGFAVIGPDGGSAVPTLCQLYDLNSAFPPRSAIAEILPLLGPAAKQAVPSLLRGLADTNAFVRFDALTALEKIHAEPALALPALLKALQDRDPAIRQAASSAIIAYGRDARSVVPELTALIRRSPPPPPSMDEYVSVQVAPVPNVGAPGAVRPSPAFRGRAALMAQVATAAPAPSSAAVSQEAAAAMKAIDSDAARELMEELHTKW